MELKSYFKKFGKGWIVIGLITAILLFIYVIENAAKFGQSVSEFIVSLWLLNLIGISILLGFVPFLIWEIIYHHRQKILNKFLILH